MEQKQIRLDTIVTTQQEFAVAQEATVCELRTRTMQGPLTK